MSGLVKKIIEFLLKRTEHLGADLDNSEAPNDPMQKKIQALREKKEMMKSALNQNTPEQKN